MKYELILSDVLIFPCFTSFKIANAVNCLVTEPILKTVDEELGILFSLSAHPYPLDKITSTFLKPKQLQKSHLLRIIPNMSQFYLRDPYSCFEKKS
jgi:hypothetical protein